MITITFIYKNNSLLEKYKYNNRQAKIKSEKKYLGQNKKIFVISLIKWISFISHYKFKILERYACCKYNWLLTCYIIKG